jgi:hypothetical protein
VLGIPQQESTSILSYLQTFRRGLDGGDSSSDSPVLSPPTQLRCTTGESRRRTAALGHQAVQPFRLPAFRRLAQPKAILLILSPPSRRRRNHLFSANVSNHRF